MDDLKLSPVLRLPRMRGDIPKRTEIWGRMRESPPQARGYTLPTYGFRREAVASPASAGIYPDRSAVS